MKLFIPEQVLRFSVLPSNKLRIAGSFILIVMLVGVTVTPSGAQNASKIKADPLGTVKSNTTVACSSGGVAGGTCYKLVISCPQVADISAHLKVNRPAGTAIGTIIFG